MSRCVRRAFLCGNDPHTGHSFEHRKQWVEDRILELGTIFAVSIHAYAVMSNHVHVVLEVDPDAANTWCSEEVARRWLCLFSGGKARANENYETRLESLATQSKRIAQLRERLGDLSWFMRCLNEPIARRANREDGCTGRFWEGRFKSQGLLDDPAVLACMVYVDLNPVRAGTASTPEVAPHTSLRRRCDAGIVEGPLLPLTEDIHGSRLDLGVADYLELVDWTGRSLHSGKVGTVATEAPSILMRIGLQPAQWLCQVPATERGFWRVIGRADSITHQAARLGRRWLRGVGFSRYVDTLSTPR